MSVRILPGEPTLKLAFRIRNLLALLLLARFERLTSSNGSNTSVRDSLSLNASTVECSCHGTPLDDLPFRANRTIRLIMGDWRQVPCLARRSGLTRLLFQPRQVERDEPEGETAGEQDCADPALVIVLEP